MLRLSSPIRFALIITIVFAASTLVSAYFAVTTQSSELRQRLFQDTEYLARSLSNTYNQHGIAELKKQIDEFRVAVFHMNNDDTQGDLYDITDEVENRYEKLRKVPEVNAYLEAELDVCRMLQQVQSQFRNGIDLNIPNV
mgnify:CR=1 FL=1